MTPFDAFDLGRPLVLEHPHGGDRVIAACWPEQMEGVDGFAWAGLGWDTNDSSFPFHFIPGPIRGDREQWEVGPPGGVIVLRVLQSWEPAMGDWERWRRWISENPDVTPERARKAARESWGTEGAP
jgi:hypothetical protein